MVDHVSLKAAIDEYEDALAVKRAFEELIAESDVKLVIERDNYAFFDRSIMHQKGHYIEMLTQVLLDDEKAVRRLINSMILRNRKRMAQLHDEAVVEMSQLVEDIHASI